MISYNTVSNNVSFVNNFQKYRILISTSSSLISHVLITILLSFSSAINADCNENMVPSSPTSQFINNLDGTVTDTATGLMWTRCMFGALFSDNGTLIDLSDDSCGNPTRLNWVEALQLASTSSFAGYTDWRLPNIKELNTIVERACFPAINQEIFPGALDTSEWSSTPSVQQYPNSLLYPNSWTINFGGGDISNDPHLTFRTNTQRAFKKNARAVRNTK